MSQPPTERDQFWPLLDAVCDGELTPEQRSDLDRCLDKNAAAQEIYIDHLWLCTQVNAWSRGRRAGEVGLARVAGRLRDNPTGWETAPDESAAGPPGGAVCSPVLLSSFLLNPLACYTFAALVLGLGLLAAWVWRAPDGGRSGQAGQLAAAEQMAAAQANTAIVARITRMRGLSLGRWARPDEAPKNPADVPLGCLYELGPGAIEIEYKSGAKVIVEGPAEYLVNSASGGALLLGKLRVTVSEKRAVGRGDSQGEGRGGRVASDSASSPRSSTGPRPSSALFTLRTPNAILTMGDTESRVWTDAAGETQADVIRGEVTLSLPGYLDGDTCVVRASGFAHVTGLAIGERMVVCNPGEPPEVFAHRLPKGAQVYSGAPGLENAPRQRQLLRSGDPDS